MKRLCVIVAADIEYKAAANVLHKLGAEDRVELLKTGIGARRFREQVAPGLSPDIPLVITGLCGGLDANLRRGDVVVYDGVRDGNGEVLDLRSRFTDELAGKFASTRGVGVSVESVITRAVEKQG